MAGSIYTSVFGTGGSTNPNPAIANASLTNVNLINSQVQGTLTTANGATVVVNTGNGGLKIGTAPNQKQGLWGATPIVQPAGTGELIGIVGNSATNVNATNMTSNGNTGSAAYSFTDVVKALKAAGVLTS